nr:hypothetical protein [Thauera phenylacetica]
MKILLSALVAGLSMAALPALAAELAPIAPMVPTTSVVPTTPMAQLPAAAAPAQPRIARGLLLLHEGRVFMAPCRDRSYVNVEDVSEGGTVLAALRDFGLAPGNNLYVELMGVQEGGLLRVSGLNFAHAGARCLGEAENEEDWRALGLQAEWAAAAGAGALRVERSTSAELDARQRTGAADAQWQADAQAIWRSS